VASQPDKNDAWLATGGSLYSVDLKTGKATMAAKIEGLSGSLTDIACSMITPNTTSPARGIRPAGRRRFCGRFHSG